MTIDRLCEYIATLGPLGQLPACGTIATLCTVPFVYLIRHFIPSSLGYGFVLVIATLLAWYIIKRAHRLFDRHYDPCEIVLDEVIGCMIALWALPLTPPYVLFAILLFRLFDISKPLGINRLEKIPGAWGILLDDCVAGLASNILVHLLCC